MSDIEEEYHRLALMALTEFSDIVVDTEIVEGKLRLHLIDGSFIDVWISRRLPGRYAVHWERRHLDGTIYRWDNTPHARHRGLSTFPHHFHRGRDDVVEESEPPESIDSLVRRALLFARDVLRRRSPSNSSFEV